MKSPIHHMPWFELKESCALQGCPVCNVINRRIDKYIDNLLFEHITDRAFRKAFRDAGGFCKEHSANLVSYKDGLAVAILYKDVLEDDLIQLAKKPGQKRKTTECPACIEKKIAEKNYLTLIIEADEELQAIMMSSDGLCMNHYKKIFLYTKKNPSWLSKFQNEKFTDCMKRTEKLISLSGWDQKDERDNLPDREKLVWKELVSLLR